VIVLDVDLPGDDGTSVCRRLRADPVLGGIPILMFTVRGRDADVLSGLQAGADDYVPKDAMPEVFVARVRRLVQYRLMAHSSVLNEQMAQIGKLLAGIVHEIRGPLGVIRGNAELMRLQIPEGDPALQYAEPIIRGAQVLQLRLEHLMAAVRSGPAVLRPLELAPLLREAVDYFHKGSDPREGRVSVVAELVEDLPAVEADAGRMLQVLLNLLANAREAVLAAGGTGAVTVRARLVAEPEVNCKASPPREGLAVEVVDNGPGIPDSLLHRIFEPFFTTKETGTGYGLYLAQEIAREHGGCLTAFNPPEGGACVAFWLPLCRE
jgi:signal transduction histidine kinase